MKSIFLRWRTFHPSDMKIGTNKFKHRNEITNTTTDSLGDLRAKSQGTSCFKRKEVFWFMRDKDIENSFRARNIIGKCAKKRHKFSFNTPLVNLCLIDFSKNTRFLVVADCEDKLTKSVTDEIYTKKAITATRCCQHRKQVVKGWVQAIKALGAARKFAARNTTVRYTPLF